MADSDNDGMAHVARLTEILTRVLLPSEGARFVLKLIIRMIVSKNDIETLTSAPAGMPGVRFTHQGFRNAQNYQLCLMKINESSTRIALLTPSDQILVMHDYNIDEFD